MKLNNLNFHQTFPPDEAMLSRLLNSEVFGEALTKEEISQQTGIPTGKSSGKVEPHICYARFMGLLEDYYSDGKHTLTLTKLGELVLEEDPGLSENVTRMLCHLRMVSPYGGAPLWETIMSEVLPHQPRGVSLLSLMDSLKRESTSNINLGPFFSSYEGGLFGPLDLIEKGDDQVKLSKHVVDHELIFVYAYALFREWELAFPGQDELTATELESLKMPDSIGWKETELYLVLEQMQDKGLIVFNRQLTPYTVTKNFAADDMIPKLYSELF